MTGDRGVIRYLLLASAGLAQLCVPGCAVIDAVTGTERDAGVSGDGAGSGSDAAGEGPAELACFASGECWSNTPLRSGVGNPADMIEDGRIKTGDFDADGSLDVVVAGPNDVRIYFGDGSGSFPDQRIVMSTSPHGVALGNFVSGDGPAQIAVSAGNELLLFAVRGDRVVSQKGPSLAPAVPAGCWWGVVALELEPKDGVTDLVCLGDDLHFASSQQDYAFTMTPILPASSAKRRSLSTGDVNIDGIEDLAFVAEDGGAILFTGTAAGNLVQEWNLPIADDQRGVAAIFGNRVVVAHSCGPCENFLAFRFYDVDGQPVDSVDIEDSSFIPRSIAVSDLDSDGFPDLLISGTGQTSPGVTPFWATAIRGAGGGTLTSDRLYLVTEREDVGEAQIDVGAVGVGQVDFRGTADLITAGDGVAVFLSTEAR